MQREIDNLKKELRHAQRKRAPSNSDMSSTDEEDVNYRQRSRTHQVSLSPMIRSTTTNVGTKAHLVKEWEMML